MSPREGPPRPVPPPRPMPPSRAREIATAEARAAYRAATLDRATDVDVLPWSLRFWLWRRRQLSKVGAWAAKWARVYRARSAGPRRERAHYPLGGSVVMIHPATLADYLDRLPAEDLARLRGAQILCSEYVPEWRDVHTLDAAGYPPWSPRFTGYPKQRAGTVAQIYNTVLALDPDALRRAQAGRWPL